MRLATREVPIDVFGPWQVRSLRCFELGRQLGAVKPAASDLHELSDGPGDAFLVELFSAASCHRTNWDRLRAHLVTRARKRQIGPDMFARMDGDTFVRDFGAAYTDDSTLAERHAMLAEVSEALDAAQPLGQLFLSFCKDPEQVTAGAVYEAVHTLDTFHADPQEKKARIFVQQLVRTGLLTNVSDDEIRPAVEYHIVRLYLRTGRVAHVKGYRQSDGGRATSVTTIAALRSAVEQAMRITAEGAGIRLLDLNDIEWQLARSFCERDKPRCFGPPSPQKPVSSRVAQLADGKCVFSDLCDGPRSEVFLGMIEPQLSERYSFY